MAPSTSAQDLRNGVPSRSKRALFEDDSEGSEAEAEAEPTLKINEEYARRFEHNKRREELHRLEEKYKLDRRKHASGAGDGDSESDDSSSDETEDEDGFLITDDLDAEISATLQAIKNKDPRIYDKNAVFYKPLDAGAAAAPKTTTEKPVTIQDYHRERYMKAAVGGEEDSDGEEQQGGRTYVQEQDELKKAILSEINAAAEGQEAEEDEEDAFVKRRADAAAPSNGIHPARAAVIKVTELDVAKADENPDDFLDKFMASKAWVQDDGHKWAAFDSDDGEGGDDLAEEFENAYNMRFEDPDKSNEVLKSYSRVLAATRSVRREEATGRKKRRILEKEKKEEEKRERQDERARLRRLKVEEAAEKLAKIKQAAGMRGRNVKDEEQWMRLLDEAWDNDKWEEDMQRRFGEEYYAEKDDDSHEEEDDDENVEDESTQKRKGPKKPKWDDDVDINDIVPDFDDGDGAGITLSDSEDGDQAVAPSEKAQDERVAEESADDEDDEEGDRPRKKRKSGKDHRKERAEAKRQARQELSKIETLVDVKMSLDDPETLAAGAKDRNTAAAAAAAAATATGSGFRYRATSPVTFGLTARDILLAPSDAALNQFAGLKRLAPFRDAERKRKDRRHLGKKARLREWRRETFGAVFERTGPTYGFGERSADAEAGGELQPAQEPAVAAAAGKTSKKKKNKNKNKKRKRKQKDTTEAAEA